MSSECEKVVLFTSYRSDFPRQPGVGEWKEIENRPRNLDSVKARLSCKTLDTGRA